MIRKPEIKIVNPVAKIAIDEVLNVVHPPGKRNKYNNRVFLGEKVNVTTLKLLTFKHKGTVCSCCGLEAQYFTLDKNKAKEAKFHMGLYAEVAGKEVIFTRDHIKPKSDGGEDTLENMQTQCEDCNQAKGNYRKGHNILLKSTDKNKMKELSKKVGLPTVQGVSTITSSKGLGIRKLAEVARISEMPILEVLQRSKIDRITREISFNYNNSPDIIPILDMERQFAFKKLRQIQGVR
jgi:hypothetical protein